MAIFRRCKHKRLMLKSFVVQILHDSYLGATAALDLGVAHPSMLVLIKNEAYKLQRVCDRLLLNNTNVGS